MNVSLDTQGSYPPGQLNWDLKEDIDISYTDIYIYIYDAYLSRMLYSCLLYMECTSTNW